MTTRFFAVIPDQKRQRVALLRKSDGYSLPEFSPKTEQRSHTVAGVNDAVRATWILPVTVSFCPDEGSKEIPAIFVLHNHDPQWAPPSGAEWVDVSSLESIAFSDPRLKSAALSWRSSINDPAWSGVPWASPEWPGKVNRWIEEKVAEIGATLLEEPIQVRTWAISYVLKVVTSQGNLFFKALPNFLGHEANLALHFEEYFPHYMEDVVATEPNSHWRLTKEWAGRAPETYEEWSAIFKAMIEIQKDSDRRVAQLLSVGVHDRSIPKLPALLAPIVDDLKDSQLRDLYGVTEEESHELTRRLQILPHRLNQLYSSGIPDTLIHGDLWGSNVIVRDEFSGRSPVIFDWADAAITHPFFDLYCVTTSEMDKEKRKIQEKAHFDAYCEIFPPPYVNQALYWMAQVAPFYYMICYRNVVMNAPPQCKWELQFLLKRFTRYALEVQFSDELIRVPAPPG